MKKSWFFSGREEATVADESLTDQDRCRRRSLGEAVDRFQAVVEFDMSGKIIDVNENFSAVMGYTRDELIGKSQQTFMRPEDVGSSEFVSLWESLRRGEMVSGEFRRVNKSGKEKWLQAYYTPLMGPDGKPDRVVKLAIDVTSRKSDDANFRGQIESLRKSMAVIEFNLDGTIVSANENFLSTMGYQLEEIQGKHHSMFAEPGYANTNEYRQFWEQLNRGRYDAGEYRRIGKGGKEVWISATYNPVVDASGKPFKVVKFATDITEQKQLNEAVKLVLAEVTEVLTGMSKGDLTREIVADFPVQFQPLKDAVNATIAQLQAVVRNIKESSANVRVGAAEISNGNSNLSARTEQQASSLEETASSMEEMTSTVKQNADNAGEANQLALAARSEAEQGGNVVNEAVDAMHAIADSSKKIADIIGVIDEIAFQTNLLALNASVEAARAGDQGRGFAVVASEVRNLAGRSAAAAKEIKDLIEDSGRKVDEGAKLVNKSGESLQSIVSGVKKVTDIVGEIAAASREQSAGIEEVNSAVMQLDELTQQNAALVEEAAAASETMGENATGLANIVNFFQVSGDGSSMQSMPPHGVERRSADRPWSNPQASAPAAPADEPVASAPMQRAVNDNDQDWEEF